MAVQPPLSLWAVAFAATVAIEAPLVAVATRRQLGPGRGLVVGIGLQGLTHPALWYAMPRFGPYEAWLVIAEGLVVTMEALALAVALVAAGQPRRAAALRGAAVAGCTNLVSTAVGWIWLG